MRRRTPPAENSAVHNSFPQRSRDNFSTTSPAPPIVHVTIGRVEVRAVLPVPPAMQKKSPPANKVSLQDHLRNGGRA
jgi:hypothetical protein